MHDKIQQARSVALEILKPGKRDLEYGTELHHDALVIEAYCLGIRAPHDPALLHELEARRATSQEITDLKLEQNILGWARSPARRRQYREIWETAGVDAVFQNAGEEGNDPQRMLKRLGNYSLLIEAMPDFLQKIGAPDDIVAAKAAGKRAIGMATNGVPLPGRCTSVGEELGLIHVFAKLGMRIAHLTYNRRNPLGDGCGEKANGGLSDFGRHAIHELNRWGVMVDLAHTGWQSCLDAIDASDKPVVVSHSAACALHETIRGKPDRVIKALIDKGGVMGITNVPGFLGLSEDINALLDHIDYVVKKFGPDSVCIGTDAAYTAQDWDSTDGQFRPKVLPPTPWESLWPDGKFGRTNPSGTQSLMWTNWPLFTVGLVQRGHSETTIRKILGENLLRVFREVWSSSMLDFNHPEANA